jgi:hypothetical protein
MSQLTIPVVTDAFNTTVPIKRAVKKPRMVFSGQKKKSGMPKAMPSSALRICLPLTNPITGMSIQREAVGKLP